MTKTTNQRDAVSAIRNRSIVKASALTAGTKVCGYGRLDGLDLQCFREQEDEITYIVYSYGTPIAWECQGQWHFVERKFSVTTSRHQNLVGRAIGA